MKATIKELRKTMFDIDFNLIANQKTLTNPEGRRFLYEIENQDLEVDFYIGSAGTFVIETKILQDA
jgi:hypothetical protein